jgi:hypothetical protein
MTAITSIAVLLCERLGFSVTVRELLPDLGALIPREIRIGLKEETGAKIKVLSGNATWMLEGRTRLAEFSAKLYDSEAMKKPRVEI